MSTRKVVGVVLGVTGVVISLGHILMILFTDLMRRYHAMEMWVALGVVLGVSGLLLLTERRQ